MLDRRDMAFSRLKVWIDRNHNGTSEQDEIQTLDEAGVERIDLAYQSSKWQDMYGNTLRYRARVFTKTGGRWAVDVWLMPAPNQQ